MLKSPRYYNISIGILKFATWVEDLYNKFVNINSYLWEKKQFFNGTTNWKTTTCFYTQLFSIAQILSWFNVHLLEQKFYKIPLECSWCKNSIVHYTIHIYIKNNSNNDNIINNCSMIIMHNQLIFHILFT
jgi:hypothetical protein